MQTELATMLAAGVLYVAWQQWKLAEHKLKSELFDRRYKIYEQVHLFVHGICRDPNTNHEALSTLLRTTREAHFLFDQDIIDYLEFIRLNAIRLELTRHTME